MQLLSQGERKDEVCLRAGGCFRSQPIVEKSLSQAAQKDPEARRAWTVIVSVDRDREIRTSTNTPHEHEFSRGD
jgi:hypothetical protein